MPPFFKFVNFQLQKAYSVWASEAVVSLKMV